MTIADLFQSGIIKDADRIRIYKQFTDRVRVVAAGPWYCDSVLEWINSEISSFSFLNNSAAGEGNRFTVTI